MAKNLEAAKQPGTTDSCTVAILPWGDVIEDYLDHIGMSIDDFCSMSGGWLFGYADALQQYGWKVVIICFSKRIKKRERRTHVHSGTPMWFIPASRSFLRLRRFSSGIGPSWLHPRLRSRLARVRMLVKNLVPYLATPPLKLARVLRREQCSVILCQDYENPRFDVCVYTGKRLSIPVFASFQGGNWHDSRIEDRLRPVSLKACDGLIISQDAELQRVISAYGVEREKIVRVLNPMNLSEWSIPDRQDVRRERDIPDDAYVIVWHGRIEIRLKGLDLLLEAYHRLTARLKGYDLRLHLMGTGPDADELQRRISTLGLNGVSWHNEFVLDRQQIYRHLAAGDVYVFPSRREGFPVAPMEAMACGLPIVATANPGITDLLEGGEKSGGIVVKPDDPVALADAVENLLTNDNLRLDLSQRARNRIESDFSLKTIGSQLDEFLKKGIR